MTPPVLLSSRSHNWRTPPQLFELLHDHFRFTVDAAADDDNALLPTYWTEEDDALVQDWTGHVVWCNPPYGRHLTRFVEKAHAEWRDNAVTTVLLIPARTDTSVWHRLIFPNADVHFLAGRLRFLNSRGERADAATFPSALVIFPGWKTSLQHFTR